MKKLYIDAKKINITPDYPVSLIGYFNDRVSKGKLDSLFCRLAAIKQNSNHLLFIQIDNCLIMHGDVIFIKREIEKNSNFKFENIMIFTSHTHTAPALTDFYKTKKEHRYLEELISKIVEGAKALNPHIECKVKIAKSNYEGLSYNRRWFLKDGRVITNPPKLYPYMDKPEGAFDREMGVIVFFQNDNSPEVIFVNISNHTDTIGGDLISSDWPGFMEKYINEALHKDIIVLPFIAPQGNINHFEFDNPGNQTNYNEAKRIGKSYARILIKSLKNLKPIDIDNLKSKLKMIKIPPREIKEKNIQNAKNILKTAVYTQSKKDLTSEDIIKENQELEWLFAKELMNYYNNKPDYYTLCLQLFLMGNILFCAIPGEPFVEIGIELKKIDRFSMTFPVACANGYFGYIPLKECFERDGYEVKASRYNCLSRNASDIILREFKNIITLIRK